MDDTTRYGHLPFEPSENSTYILPDLVMKDELLDVEDPLYLPLKLESPTEIEPIIAKKEDLLDLLEFKEESDILHDLVVSGKDTDQFITDNKDIIRRVGSGEDLISCCEEEILGNNTATVHHNTASAGSGMQISGTVKQSSLSDCKISSVHQYFTDTVKERLLNGKTSSVQSTEIQTRLHETNIRNKPVLHHDIFNTAKQILTCNENKRNCCETCHKCFRTPYSLKTHVRIHTGSKPYTCDICHNCFRQLSALKIHSKIHTGIKSYTCDTCHKCFSQLSNLRTHAKIHTGSKPYTCDTCRKSFTHLSSLKIHTRIHTGSKPYTCDTCHKCFSVISNLKKHTKIHADIKSYTCDTCHTSFSQLSQLKKHTKIHTG